MTTERATKVVDRLEMLGVFEYEAAKSLSKMDLIEQFERMNESDIKPEFVKFIDMSDFKFMLELPMLRAVFKTIMRNYQKTIERNLKKMTATT